MYVISSYILSNKLFGCICNFLHLITSVLNRYSANYWRQNCTLFTGGSNRDIWRRRTHKTCSKRIDYASKWMLFQYCLHITVLVYHLNFYQSDTSIVDNILRYLFSMPKISDFTLRTSQIVFVWRLCSFKTFLLQFSSVTLCFKVLEEPCRRTTVNSLSYFTKRTVWRRYDIGCTLPSQKLFISCTHGIYCNWNVII